MKVAALDLGSNTFICLICDVETTSDGSPRIARIITDEVKMVRLGQGLSQNKFFHPDALKRADQALSEFKKIIDQHQPEKILAMATAAARDASNGDQLFAMAEKYKIPVEIISGSQEAQISFSGATSGFKNPNKATLVIDIGGGSTELILGIDQKITWAQSVNVGTVKLRERTITSYPVSVAEQANLESSVDKEFTEPVQKLLQHIPKNSELQIVAVAGTPTEIARLENHGHFVVDKIDGLELDTQKLSNWKEKLSSRAIPQILSELGVTAGREDLLLPGIQILMTLLKKLSRSHLQVSTRGVRFGVALELANKKQRE